MNRRSFIQRIALGILSLPFINKIPRKEYLPPTKTLFPTIGNYRYLAGADIHTGDLLVYKDYGQVVPVDVTLTEKQNELVTIAGIAGNNARAYVDKVKVLSQLKIKGE